MYKTFNEHLDPTLEFCIKRKKGAAKIAKSAKEKGGVSMLTYYHFSAKLPVYQELIEESQKNKLDINKLKTQFNELSKKLSFDLEPKEFQQLTGKLEVLGEVIIQMS